MWTPHISSASELFCCNWAAHYCGNVLWKKDFKKSIHSLRQRSLIFSKWYSVGHIAVSFVSRLNHEETDLTRCIWRPMRERAIKQRYFGIGDFLFQWVPINLMPIQMVFHDYQCPDFLERLAIALEFVNNILVWLIYLM